MLFASYQCTLCWQCGQSSEVISVVLIIIRQGVWAHGRFGIGLLKGGGNLEQGAELSGEQWALAHEEDCLLFFRCHLFAGPQHLFSGQGDGDHMLLGLGVVPALDLQAFASWVLMNLAWSASLPGMISPRKQPPACKDLMFCIPEQGFGSVPFGPLWQYRQGT